LPQAKKCETERVNVIKSTQFVRLFVCVYVREQDYAKTLHATLYDYEL